MPAAINGNLARSLRSAAIAATWTLVLCACAVHRTDVEPAMAETATTLFPTGATWGDGWSFLEQSDVTGFRWMSGRSEVRLAPAHRWSTMRLFVELVVPLGILRRPPTIRILLDGRLLDRFEGLSGTEPRSYLVAASAANGLEPRLVIETSETVDVNGRTLGVALQRASWDAVGGAP
jgi:hypothetical protein